MTAVNFELTPPQRLAVAYAREDLRPALALLLAFDARLAGIVGRAGEPMVAQMKLAWWYDVISRDSASRPKGEPILQALGDVSVPLAEESMRQLLDAWGILLAAEEWTSDVLARFAKTRSSAVFGAYATWVGSTDVVANCGESWALVDLQQRFGVRANVSSDIMTSKLLTNRKVRPLSILAFSVADPSGVQMIWHALTGR